MARKSNRKSNRKIVARLGWLALFIIILGVAVIDREKLPESWQQNATVIDLYAKRDALLGRAPETDKEAAAIAAPAPAENPGTGYSAGDRGQLDKLISKGAEDH